MTCPALPWFRTSDLMITYHMLPHCSTAKSSQVKQPAEQYSEKPRGRIRLSALSFSLVRSVLLAVAGICTHNLPSTFYGVANDTTKHYIYTTRRGYGATGLRHPHVYSACPSASGFRISHFFDLSRHIPLQIQMRGNARKWDKME